MEGDLRLTVDKDSPLVWYIREGYGLKLKDRLTDERIELERCYFCYALDTTYCKACDLRFCARHQKIHETFHQLKKEKSMALESLREVSVESKRSIESLRDNVREIKGEVNRLSKENQVLCQALENLKEEIGSIKEKKQGLRDHCRDLEEEVKRYKTLGHKRGFTFITEIIDRIGRGKRGKGLK